MSDERGKCTLSDEKLCEKAQYWISELLDSNGNAWCLRIPVDLNHDPDVVFDELINRVKARTESAAELQALRDRAEKLEEFAESVIQWSKAYPTSVFTEPTPEEVDEVCKTLGFRIDRIAAMVLREYTESWGKKAAEALKESENDPK